MNFSPFGGMGGLMFVLVPILVLAGFGLVFGLIVAQLVRGGRQWKRNNAAPVLTVDATIVTKRADVHYHRHSSGNDTMQGHSSSTYYATFQVASGDRMELELRDIEYGLLAERDVGKLTFQGTRYLGFVRS